MLKWIARRRLDAFENAFDYDASYMRAMLDTSWKGFLRFNAIVKLAAHREDVPVDAWHAAKLVGTIAEDCGPCTQLGVRMAEAAGVPSSVLRGVLTNDENLMGSEVALAVRFARAAIAHDPVADELRERIVALWGERGLLSLALAMSATRVFPAVKYALGHGKACSRVRVGNSDALPVRVAPAA